MSARGRPVTVTEVTPRFGLADLVRFSVEYRKKFERSSKTLCQAVRKRQRRKSALQDYMAERKGSATHIETIGPGAGIA
jgi:hypothetical protein